MARIGPMNVDVGNYTYPFVVYDLDGPFYNAAGVYIFSKGTINSQGVNEHQFLYHFLYIFFLKEKYIQEMV